MFAAAKETGPVPYDIDIPNDHAMLEQGVALCDALYACCRDPSGEIHSRKPATAPAATTMS